MSDVTTGMTPPEPGRPVARSRGAGATPRLQYTIVAAIAANGVIGVDGDLAWRDREDLRRVKALTMGHTLVMGRKNFDSIGRPLPGRRTVVITRQADWAHEGVTVVHDADAELTAALQKIATATGDGEIFVFGGGEIYTQLLDRAQAMEVTEIATPIEGDVRFPDIDPDDWWEVNRVQREGFAWVRYVRRDLPTASC